MGILYTCIYIYIFVYAKRLICHLSWLVGALLGHSFGWETRLSVAESSECNATAGTPRRRRERTWDHHTEGSLMTWELHRKTSGVWSLKARDKQSVTLRVYPFQLSVFSICCTGRFRSIMLHRPCVCVCMCMYRERERCRWTGCMPANRMGMELG